MLEGRTVVVTGGCGLIGSAFCRSILEAGATTVIADLDYSKTLALKAAFDTEFPEKSIAAELDITDEHSIYALIKKVVESNGRIDGVVSNAYPKNKSYGAALDEVSYAGFCENLNLHLGGYFLTNQKFAKLFAAQKNGVIINMASIYGVIAPKFQIYKNTLMTMPVEYSAIKAGILSLTRYFAQYYKKDHVRVNALSPGGIADGQPQSFQDAYKSLSGAKGMLDPQDLVGTLIYLLSDNAQHVTGQNIVIDGGFSL
ncbi:MAG: SDR family oxidoreductase [Alphaproteobacteria bacterium]|nr:SDR family oxidoreductase [Alphaproteobacteria bacterium]